jgi:Tol biopolymer transport system component
VRGSNHGFAPSPSSVSWSADGAWLVFTGFVGFAGLEGERRGIYRIRADGTGLRFIRGTKGGRSPILSPDGSKIAFVRDRFKSFSNMAATTWVADADGRNAVRVTPWRKNIEYLPSSFSRDGSELAVTKSNVWWGGSTVLLLRLDRSQHARVLARRASEAVFSPDGSHIALVRHRESGRGKVRRVINKDLYVMNADGTASKAVTHTHRIAERQPSWDPSGQRIAFDYFRVSTSKDLLEALFDELIPAGNSIGQVNADGSCRQKIISLRNAAIYWPVWRSGPGREAGPIEC